MKDVRRARLGAVALCATLVVGGCAGTDDASRGESPARPSGEEETVSPDPTAIPGAGTPQARQAVADLAARLDVAADEVSVVAVEAVTWNDGSLGCAEKGMMYTQALVEGTRIMLRAGDRTYEYHAGGQRPPFYCANPTQ
jgi:hypothetical protein